MQSMSDSEKNKKHCVHCGKKIDGDSAYFCSKRCKKRVKDKLVFHNNRAKELGVPGKIGMPDWIACLKDSNWSCFFCGFKNGNPFEKNRLSIDHVYPLTKGGFNMPFNIQCVCTKCHRKKDRWVELSHFQTTRLLDFSQEDVDKVFGEQK